MKKLNNITLLMGLLITACLMTSKLHAGIIEGTHWLIEPGDSLYKIARKLYPTNAKKRERARKELVSQNPHIFKNGNNQISVGDKLALPEFSITLEDASPIPVKELVATETIPAASPITPTTLTAEKITVDPEDIIGKVIINVGSLSAQNRGSTRALNRRSPIYRGDTLTTGGRSLTQIRLKDGALLSLRPYTEIKIAEYSYNGSQDGSEKSVLELLKGGFRTITGLIGHKNKQNYQVRTSVATIGIRGTHYSLVLCQQASCNDGDTPVDDGLYGGVADGSIVLENETGIHRFNNDQYFKLTSASALPVEFLLPPTVLKHGKAKLALKNKSTSGNKQAVSQKSKSTPRRLAVIFEANQPDISRRSRVILPDLKTPPLIENNINKAPNGSGAIISFNEIDNIGVLNGVAAGIVVTAKNNNEIILGPNRVPIAVREISYDIELDKPIVNELILGTEESGFAKLDPSSVGGDPKLGVNWGRWDGQFTVFIDTIPSKTKENLHYIYSENLTSAAQIANLGQTIGTTSYFSVDGTLPTDLQGNIATIDNLPFIDLTVDFSQKLITQYSVSATVGGVNYFASIDQAGVPLSDIASGFNISNASSGDFGQASVLFVGDQAQGALTAYQIQNAQGTNAINGTALLVPSAILTETIPQ